MPILIRNTTFLSFFLPPILHSFLKKYWVSVTCKASNTVGNNASCVLLSHILLFSCSIVSDSLQPYELQQARLPCPSLPPRAGSNSCPLSWWHHPRISSFVAFSSCLQSSPAPGSFPVSQLLASGGQSIRVSASTSVLSMNIQDWFPLGWTGWISLQSKGFSRVFSK